MAGKNTAVFGIYPERTSVERAVDALRQEGFRSTDISVLFPENQGTKDFAHEKNTKAPEGTATGATSGAVIGGTLGWLAGIGALAIPGLGPFIAAVQSWQLLPAQVRAELSAALPGPSLEWVSLSMKRNDMKDESKRAVFYSQFIPTILSGLRRPRRSWSAPAHTMSPLLVRRLLTFRKLTNP
jgi:hypothetical protein